VVVKKIAQRFLREKGNGNKTIWNLRSMRAILKSSERLFILYSEVIKRLRPV